MTKRIYWVNSKGFLFFCTLCHQVKKKKVSEVDTIYSEVMLLLSVADTNLMVYVCIAVSQYVQRVM